jgi:hypothetical protein
MLTQYSSKISNSIAVIGTNFQLLESFGCEDFVTALFGLANIYITANSKKLSKDNLEVWMHIACFSYIKARDD